MAVHPELESLIEASPDDAALFHMYADWLQSQGDPRGELMALQLRCETADPRETALRAAEAALRARYADQFGPVQDRHCFNLRWRRGFLESVRYDSKPAKTPALEALFAHPSARFLRGLELVRPDLPDAWWRAQPPRTITRLQLAREVDSMHVRELSQALPRLEWLVCSFWSPRPLGGGAGAQLRRLSVQAHSALVGRALRAPNLEELNVTYLSPDDLTAIATNPGTPRLRRLSLASPALSLLVPTLARTPLARRLEALQHDGFPDARSFLEDLEQNRSFFPALKIVRVGGMRDRQECQELEGRTGWTIEAPVHASVHVSGELPASETTQE